MFSQFIDNLYREKRVSELDDRLVDALFFPALDGIWFDENELNWKNKKCQYIGSDFITDLGKLSEFYQEKNPVLSASLWGIWNTLQYSNPMGLWSAIFPRQRKQHRLFHTAKALAATAAIQFANGNADTVSTSSIIFDQKPFEIYLKFADNAIQHLIALKDTPSSLPHRQLRKQTALFNQLEKQMEQKSFEHNNKTYIKLNDFNKSSEWECVTIKVDRRKAFIMGENLTSIDIVNAFNRINNIKILKSVLLWGLIILSAIFTDQWQYDN